MQTTSLLNVGDRELTARLADDEAVAGKDGKADARLVHEREGEPVRRQYLRSAVIS